MLILQFYIIVSSSLAAFSQQGFLFYLKIDHINITNRVEMWCEKRNNFLNFSHILKSLFNFAIFLQLKLFYECNEQRTRYEQVEERLYSDVKKLINQIKL